MRQTRLWTATAALAAGLLLAGCGGGASDTPADVDPAQTQDPADTQEPTEPEEPTGAEEPTSDSESSGSSDADGCYIHLFDGDDFDENDDNFKLTEPGKYENLANLPGADKDWTDEADSLKVGDAATVTIYADENFEGASQQLDPGTEVADVDNEPDSLEMTCD